MLENIQSILRDPCQLDPQQPIIVGVSGGPDSLCLLGVLRQAGYRTVVAHFNHNLRPESGEEATAVEAIAARFMIPYTTDSKDVRAYAGMERLSIEEAARNLRYRFLFDQAHRFEAQAVAVGHTSDDQVETVLMHFIRGSGLSGLKGMSYRTLLDTFDRAIPLVRPLLDVSRAETVAYCAAENLIPHQDPSNESLDYRRNRIRHALIPTLETYNPRIRQTIWRSVQSLGSDHALLEELLDLKWGKCVLRETELYVALDIFFLQACSIGLRRNLIRRAVEHLLPGQETTYAILDRAQAFIYASTSRRTDLTGGLVILREEDALYIAKSDAHLPADHWPQLPDRSDSLAVSVPGHTQLSAGWTFSAQEWRNPPSAWAESSANRDRFQVWLDAESLAGKLELRVRRRGDVLEPLGIEGHSQKLSDFFTNVKLPRRARERWPLLIAGDQVAWVPGFRPAESFKLKQTSSRVYYFSLTQLPRITKNP